MNPKKGILLVTFGTSQAQAMVAIENIVRIVKTSFPDFEVRLAFTSAMIRRKLRKEGVHYDSPAFAMAKMDEEGFTHVAVQSLHVIPGFEFDDLKNTISAFSMIPKTKIQFSLGSPLLFQHDDFLRLSSLLEKMIPIERKSNQAFLFMGHGTHHCANAFYPALQYYMWQISPFYFLATVEGFPSLEQIIPTLKEKKMENVCLIPLMTVAGDHAINDMAGEEEDSWKSVLEADGFQTQIVMKGMAEIDDIVLIWVDHLKTALEQLLINN